MTKRISFKVRLSVLLSYCYETTFPLTIRLDEAE